MSSQIKPRAPRAPRAQQADEHGSNPEDPESESQGSEEADPHERNQGATRAARPTHTLSIVATPIGNLEDITLRALRTLREADSVLAEDTRRTRVLCQQHGLRCNLRAFHAHSSPQLVEQIMDELQAGKHIALVTDAGTPLLSDPGARLVEAAHARGLRVESVPGASAITAALTVAALPVDHFRFVGFLPRSGRRRRDALTQIVRDNAATVVFESPRRLLGTLEELAQQLPAERRIAVCRELTKLHEEVLRGSPAELVDHFRHTAPRGEVTMVIAGSASDTTEPEAPDLDERIATLHRSGLSTKDAAAQLARETGLRKHALYARIELYKAALSPDDTDDADDADDTGLDPHHGNR